MNLPAEIRINFTNRINGAITSSRGVSMHMKLTAVALLLMVCGPFGQAIGVQPSNTVSRWDANTLPGVAPLDSDIYTRICGKCHYPYQPGLLSALSWEKLMIELPAHFSTNLDLPPSSVRNVFSYVLNNAAGRVDYEVSKKIMASTKPGETPARVTATGYFLEMHRTLASSTGSGSISQNLSDCTACHKHAKEGTFK